MVALRFQQPATIDARLENVPLGLGTMFEMRSDDGDTFSAAITSHGLLGRPMSSRAIDTLEPAKLQPGTWNYTVSVRGPGPPLASGTVTVGVGEKTMIVATLPKLHELVLEKGRSEISTVRLIHAGQPNGQQTHNVSFGSDGRSIFPYLPEGVYTVRCLVSGQDWREQTISLNTNMTVRIGD